MRSCRSRHHSRHHRSTRWCKSTRNRSLRTPGQCKLSAGISCSSRRGNWDVNNDGKISASDALVVIHQLARVVIINWPSKETRTVGVLTATFVSEESEKQLAAVYVPTAPQTRLGDIRIVSLADVEFTDWTLRQ